MAEFRCLSTLSVSGTSTSYQHQSAKALSACSWPQRYRGPQIRGRQKLKCRALLGFLRKETAPTFQTLEDRTLFEWLSDRGLPHQKVTLADCGEQGRGLIARERIKAGETLLQVPEALLLTPELCLQHCRLEPVLADADLPAWSLLALYLVDVDIAAEEGVSLPWSAYVSALPRQSGCVLEWTPEQVRALKGSPTARAAEEILTAADRTWKQLEPLIKQAEERSLIPANCYTRDRVLWGLSMLLSRLARLPARKSVEACIPWADFLNHAADANCYLDWDESAEGVVLRPDRAYKAGDQVFTSYGPKTNGELLLSYGFVCAPGTNPNDACRLRLAIDRSDPTYSDKLESLDRHRLRAQIDFPLKLSGLPSGLLQYAAFVEAQPSEPGEVQQLGDYLFGQGGFPTLDGVNTELLGIEVAIDECRKALSSYPSSLEASQQQLEEQRRRSPKSIMASILAVRVQEQKVLHRTIFALQQQKRMLTNASERPLAL